MKKLMFVAALAALSTSAFAEMYAYDLRMTYKSVQPKAEKTKTYTVTVGQNEAETKWYEYVDWIDAKGFKYADDESKESIAKRSFGFDPETGTSEFDFPIPGEKSFTFKYKASANGEYYFASGTERWKTFACFDSIGADRTSPVTGVELTNIKTLYIGGATHEKAKKVLISGDIHTGHVFGKFSGTGTVDKNGMITSVSGTIVGDVMIVGNRVGKGFKYDQSAGALVDAEGLSSTPITGTFTMKYSKTLSKRYDIVSPF